MTDDLDSCLDVYLAAQQRFDRLRADAARQAGTALADLAYANAYDGPPPEVLDALRDCLSSERSLALQYTPYGGSTITRRLVATDLSAQLPMRLEWRDVIMTPGAMAALNVVFRALRTNEGRDEVIVIVPAWLDYPLYLVNLGLKPVFVQLDAQTLRLDLERIRAAIGPATRAVVLSQPANPTGLVYSAEELNQLGALLEDCSGGRIMLISDECHRDLTFDGQRFVPPAAHYANTCIVYSFGKRFLIQGQRCGYVAVSPRMPGHRDFRERLERFCRIMGFCTPTSVMQLAVARLLAIPSDGSRFASRRQHVLAALDHGGYSYPKPQATFFIYPRVPGGDEEQFTRRLAERGVLVLPAAVFHHSGYFRLALTAPDDHIERAAGVLTALGEIRQ